MEPSLSLLLALGIALAATAPLLALPLWRMGRRVRREGVFPPPGARLLRPVAPVHGRAARLRGSALQLMAVLLLVAGLLPVLMLLALLRLAS